MLWFCKSLPDPTDDDIEINNCHNHPSNKEDVAVGLIELITSTECMGTKKVLTSCCSCTHANSWNIICCTFCRMQ